MLNMENSEKKEPFDFGQAHMTSYDIKNYREILSEIIIAPFDENKAKGIGYNFSLSEMVYSINRKRLVPICREENGTYFFLRRNETVLVLSYEYLKVGESVAGSFHSRVRMTAMGIGSTSTTLDPNWKGMLLFSLNNPTNKKIKITLSTRQNGNNTPHAAITLAAWKTKQLSQFGQHNESLSLSLDNPPMRTDIWSELTVKPLSLFNNNEYQRFRKLVESISCFEPQPTLLSEKILGIKALLVELMENIKSSNEDGIITKLVQLKYISDLNCEIAKRLSKLTDLLSEQDLLKAFAKEENMESLEISIREIEYQMLCEQVRQIHMHISKSVPVSWRTNIGANIRYHVVNNLGSIIATMLFIALIIYGRYTDTSFFWQSIVLAFVPLVVSIISNLLTKHK